MSPHKTAKKRAPRKRQFFQMARTIEAESLFAKAGATLAGPIGEPGVTDIIKTALRFTIKYYRWVLENHPDFEGK